MNFPALFVFSAIFLVLSQSASGQPGTGSLVENVETSASSVNVQAGQVKEKVSTPEGKSFGLDGPKETIR